MVRLKSGNEYIDVDEISTDEIDTLAKKENNLENDWEDTLELNLEFLREVNLDGENAGD